MSAYRDPLADPKPLIRKLYAYVAYVVGEGAEAEDLTSEAFERALRYRNSFDPSRGTPIAWLIGIARRCIANRRTEPIADDVEPEDQPATGDLELEAVDRVVLHAAIAALAERDRELISLRFGADLTARQIGEILELQTNAVEVALHRALARLRAELASPSRPSQSEFSRKGLDLAGGME